MCPHPSKPNSFAVAIRDRDWFKEAIRTKLVLEVAGGTPERRVVPVAEMSRGCVLNTAPCKRDSLTRGRAASNVLVAMPKFTPGMAFLAIR